MSIGNNMRKIRKEKNLTLQQIADKMNCSPQNIAQYENGKRMPKLETLQKIASVLDVDINKLLGNERFPFEPELRETYVNFDNKERHHLLIHHYDEMGRIGRDSLIEILAYLKILNDDGQMEASKRVEELTEIPRYTKKEKPDKE